MRHARLVTLGIALAIGSTLVACGGGGSGSSNAPSVIPPNPAGPSAPTSTAPTPISSASTPPSTSTTPPSSTSTLPPLVPASSAVISIGFGQTNPTNASSPYPLLDSSAQNTRGYQGGGNLMPGDPGAVTTGGQNGNGGGGQGAAVDGIPCNPSMAELYHVHFFVGVYDNGQEQVVPAGVGMVNPNPPNQYIVNDQPTSTPAPAQTYEGVPNQSWTADCYYDMHVHDNSGMVHIETSSNGDCGYWTYYPATPAPNAKLTPCTQPDPAMTLGHFLDIWGISLGPNNFGRLTGSVQIYGTPPGYISYSACGTDNLGNVDIPCQTSSSAYQRYFPTSSNMTNPMSVANGIQLLSHTTIWIVVGTPLPSGLPSINWSEGNP
jgi:hypothetical protein